MLRTAWGIILGLTLSSCAINTIRLDRATEMGKAGKAATDGTLQIMDRVSSANREVLIGLAAADPKCVLPHPLIASGPGAKDQILCRAGVAQPQDFEIKRFSYREFKPSMAVINGIAAYLGAVDAVVTRKPVDLGAEVADAEAELRGVAEDITAIAGGPALPDLTSDQKSAISATLTLLGSILDEAARVRTLKDMELKLDTVEFDRNIDLLQQIDKTLIADLNSQIFHQRTLLMIQLKRMDTASVEARRPLVARQLDLIDAQDKLPELDQALKRTTEAFRKAHVEYRALLLDPKSPLTASEKRKAAKITQDRVLGALHNLAALVKAF